MCELSGSARVLGGGIFFHYLLDRNFEVDCLGEDVRVLLCCGYLCVARACGPDENAQPGRRTDELYGHDHAPLVAIEGLCQPENACQRPDPP